MNYNSFFFFFLIKTALEYARFEWCADEKNILHGTDPDGVRVDTPDVTWKGEHLDCGWYLPDQINIGVPYSWGDASTLQEFENGIKSGKYAGNVPDVKPCKVSAHTVGVDCSGLITVCWDLPKKIAARDIPGISDVIGIDKAEPGDVFAADTHVMLIYEFMDEKHEKVKIIDSTRSTGKVSVREFKVADLINTGFCELFVTFNVMPFTSSASTRAED